MAGVGPNFLDDLLSSNLKESMKEIDTNVDEDMIKLIDESEHLFIRYA